MQLLKNLLISLLFWQFMSAAAAQDLLPEEQAFEFVAEQQPDGSVKAAWIIADDYYMYREKMRFFLAGNRSTALDVAFPEGKEKDDALFGKVEVYTTNFAVTLPADQLNAGKFTLIAEGQGCNEPVGVCYPPMVREVSFGALTDNAGSTNPDPVNKPLLALDSQDSSNAVGELRALLSTPPESSSSEVATAEDATAEIKSVEELRSLLSQEMGDVEFLDVDEAFSLQFTRSDASSVIGNFEVTPGYYLYKDKIKLEASGGGITSIGLPDAKIKQDKYFGEVEIYDHSFSLPVTLAGDASNTVITATYQGCAVDGICYAPVTKQFDLSVLGIAVADATAAETVSSPESGATGTKASGNSSLGGSLGGLLLGAFLAGLLLTFTPCVLPMIPILSSIIAGQGEKVTRTTGGLLALSYVIGTMVTYGAMGALAGATGDQLQAYFQNIWAIGALSLLFLVMALSMFGLFEIQMPSFIQNSIQAKTGSMGGSIPLVFVLGVFSALIVGACVSPVLVSFLGIAMGSRDPVLGAQLMLAMALGMGIPLILLGVGAGHFIPRAGQWMEKVKHGFGVMLVAVAIYLLGLLPQVPVLFLWAVFFIMLSVFLGATSPPSSTTTTWQRLEKGVGIILLVWGILLLIGGFLGQRDMFNPIPKSLVSAGSGTSTTSSYQHVAFEKVSNLAELDVQLIRARSEGKNAMIDYYADWCVECIRMEETTFADAEVVDRLDNAFVSIQIDLTDPNDPDGKALKQRYNIFGPPATLFFDRNGTLLSDRNFYGYKDSGEFLATIEGL